MAQLPECKEAIKLSAPNQWYPYVIADNLTSSGADSELVRNILEAMDCELVIGHVPERRVLTQLNEQHFHMTLGASKNPEREKQYHFSKPYRNEVNRLAYRIEDKDIQSTTSLPGLIAKQKIFAINLGGWYGDDIERAKESSELFMFSDTVQKRLEMLSLKRVDVVIDDDVVLCSQMRNFEEDNMQLHPMVISQGPIHFLFKKELISLEFVARFNAVLEQLKQTGKLQSHFKNHLPTNCYWPESQTF